MTDQQPSETPSDAADLEYDLAHEGSEVAQKQTPHWQDRSRTSPAPMPVTTSDYSGDYGYDLAHDISGH